jgi:hypothetical protein
LAPIEQAVEPGERVAFGLVGGVGVNLQRCADPGVPEDGLGIAGRDVEVLQQRGDRVSDVMNGDHPDVVVVADAPNDRTKLRGSTGRPVLVVKTRPLPCQAEPMSA